jgi:NDP-sugar pyrophosphorylase family protein
MKAMVFAAGLGTRLKDETSLKPKALVEVGGKTLLSHAIEKLKKSGITEIVINVHHFADQVIQYVNSNDFGIKIHISDERDLLLDTGGGLKKVACFLSGNEPILIYNVDILSNINLSLVKKQHLESGALATLTVRKRETQRYLKFNNKQLTGWINKKTGETKISLPEVFENSEEMAFSGIHIVQPEIFKMMPETERFSIIDLYLELAKTQKIMAFYDDSDLWIDVGKPEELEAARKIYK